MSLKQKSLRELVVMTREVLNEGTGAKAKHLAEVVREVRSRGEHVQFVDLYLDLFAAPSETA